MTGPASSSTVPPGVTTADPWTAEAPGRLAQVTVRSLNAPLVRTSTRPGWEAGLADSRRVARRLVAAAGTPRSSNLTKPWSFCAAVLRTRSSVVS